MGSKRIQIGHHDDEEACARKYNEYVQLHDLGNQLNDVDANGTAPTTFKRSSRFLAFTWHADRGEVAGSIHPKRDARPKTCHVGYSTRRSPRSPTTKR